MLKSEKRLLYITFTLLAVLSAYPMYKGIWIIVLHLIHGSIRPEEYARYIIPYTAVCMSVLITVGLYPLVMKLKRFPNLIAAAIGAALFIAIELFMENITLNTPEAKNLLVLQLASCIGTTAAQRAFQRFYDNTFKIHYFLISFVIIIMVVDIVYSYGRMLTTGDKAKSKVIWLQIVSFILFLSLCITANFTGFFRETTDYLSPLSSILTGTFFIVLGVTFGIYLGAQLQGKRKLFSIGLPALSSIVVCSIMYYGEYKLLGGVLYRFGYSNCFKPLPYGVVSPIDVLIILSSGLITYILMGLISRPKKGKHYKANLTS